MELQVPYSVCAKISKESVFRRKTLGDKGDIENIVPIEGCGDNRKEKCVPTIYTC